MPGGARIRFVRSGGVTGTRLSVDLDAAELPEDDVTELERVAREGTDAVPSGSDRERPGGADRFQFDIEVTRGDERLRLTLGEDQVPETLQAAIKRLTDLARSSRRSGTARG